MILEAFYEWLAASEAGALGPLSSKLLLGSLNLMLQCKFKLKTSMILNSPLHAYFSLKFPVEPLYPVYPFGQLAGIFGIVQIGLLGFRHVLTYY